MLLFSIMPVAVLFCYGMMRLVCCLLLCMVLFVLVCCVCVGVVVVCGLV